MRLGSFDVWCADVSAKPYLNLESDIAPYLVAGGGAIWATDYPVLEPTVHLGLGAEFGAWKQAYLRLEA